MHRSGGFTLVEVMVAMVISLIVLGGVYRAITDETINFAKDEAVLDMQNNARVAIARIAGDLWRTGFFGCGGKLSYPASYTFPSPIDFSNNDAAEADDIDDGTDAITLAFLGGDVPLAPAPSALTISTDPTKNFTLARRAFATGESLLITDCEEYAVFNKTNPTDDTFLLGHGNLDLKRAYGAPLPARVYNFESFAYRIDGGSLRLNGSDVVAENIEDLQFEFMTDSDNDGKLDDESWVETFPAGEVRAVRVWVLAMSDPVYTHPDTDTYDYPNSPYASATSPFTSRGIGSPASQAALANNLKHRYRYLASAIIYLRNAGLV
jgi:type IV pilus assembly protein PilW